MAAPHVSGIGALIKQYNPSWTPSMIASSISTTASKYDNCGEIIMAEGPEIASIYPSTYFDIGVGLINPSLALDPALVFPSDTCKKLSDEDPINLSNEFCMTTLQVNPNSKTADLYGLGAISLNLTMVNATYVKSQFQKLMDEQQQPGGNIEVSKSCNVCVEVYSFGLFTLNKVIKNFESKGGYDTVGMSAVCDSPVTCEDAFQEVNLTSPLAKENSNFLHLCAIPLGILDELRHSPNI